MKFRDQIPLTLFLLLLSAGVQAQVRAVTPSQTSVANRLQSPGVDAGDYVYVSGQGPRRPDGSLPPTFPRKCARHSTTLRRW